MKINVTKKSTPAASYRAACVKSLFNVDSPEIFEIEADIPIEDMDWQIGLIVGASGSGKTTLGRHIFANDKSHNGFDWPRDKPIIDAIGKNESWQKVTAALTSVGLGSVPPWLRPFNVLSTGEKFRAELARIICQKPKEIVIDEFTSVVDRQIAKVGSAAFAKSWRKTGGKAVLLSCHYDVIDWLEPDWIYDTNTGEFTTPRGSLRRPKIELEIKQGNWSLWPYFETHHYLKLPHMIAATNYVGFIDNKPICHLAVSTRPGLVEGRACRLVVLPEWQGIGVGLKFLNTICEMWRRGQNRYNKPMPVLFHTSHPGLIHVLRRSDLWDQVSAPLWGGRSSKDKGIIKGTYGGHFRASQGFRYFGTEDKIWKS